MRETLEGGNTWAMYESISSPSLLGYITLDGNQFRRRTLNSKPYVSLAKRILCRQRNDRGVHNDTTILAVVDIIDRISFINNNKYYKDVSLFF